MERMFRYLRADEIDVRVAQINSYGVSLLLYKDARVDQNVLDETFGPFGWKREHKLIGDRLYCTVSIKSPDGEWVSKEDVGTESNTEKEKGQASDSFKRACFNWGIGRELYTGPDIRVWNPRDGKNPLVNVAQKGDRYVTYDKFSVGELECTDGAITRLTIKNLSMDGKIVFAWGKAATPEIDIKEVLSKPKETINNMQADALREACSQRGVSHETVLRLVKADDILKITNVQWYNVVVGGKYWERLKKLEAQDG